MAADACCDDLVALRDRLAGACVVSERGEAVDVAESLRRAVRGRDRGADLPYALIECLAAALASASAPVRGACVELCAEEVVAPAWVPALLSSGFLEAVAVACHRAITVAETAPIAGPAPVAATGSVEGAAQEFETLSCMLAACVELLVAELVPWSELIGSICNSVTYIVHEHAPSLFRVAAAASARASACAGFAALLTAMQSLALRFSVSLVRAEAVAACAEIARQPVTAELLEAAMSLLATLTEDEAGCETVARCALGALIRVVGSCRVAATAVLAAEALLRMAAAHDHLGEALARAGAAPPLVGLLADDRAGARGWGVAAAALLHLASATPTCRAAVLAAGPVEVLVARLCDAVAAPADPDTLVLAECACCLLEILCCGEESVLTLLVDSRFVPIGVSMLVSVCTWDGSEEVERSLSQVLLNLAGLSEGITQMIRISGELHEANDELDMSSTAPLDSFVTSKVLCRALEEYRVRGAGHASEVLHGILLRLREVDGTAAAGEGPAGSASEASEASSLDVPPVLRAAPSTPPPLRLPSPFDAPVYPVGERDDSAIVHSAIIHSQSAAAGAPGSDSEMTLVVTIPLATRLRAMATEGLRGSSVDALDRMVPVVLRSVDVPAVLAVAPLADAPTVSLAVAIHPAPLESPAPGIGSGASLSAGAAAAADAVPHSGEPMYTTRGGPATVGSDSRADQGGASGGPELATPPETPRAVAHVGVPPDSDAAVATADARAAGAGGCAARPRGPKLVHVQSRPCQGDSSRARTTRWRRRR